MAKESTAKAGDTVIPADVKKAAPDLNGSDSDSNDLSFRGEREGVTFDTAGLESHYKPIESYEGWHRYDPKFEWEPKEEKRVVRKVRGTSVISTSLNCKRTNIGLQIDKRICAWVCLMFFALQLDRGNIQQALSDNMLPDLGLNTNDYNYGQTIFYLSFLAAELPSQLISKKLGPDNWIPVQMYAPYFPAMASTFGLFY